MQHDPHTITLAQWRQLDDLAKVAALTPPNPPTISHLPYESLAAFEKRAAKIEAAYEWPGKVKIAKDVEAELTPVQRAIWESGDLPRKPKRLILR